MTFELFQTSLADAELPVELSPYLSALWHEAVGDWDKAHQIVQDIETVEASAIHAYLHRKEGDESNARYWYGRAGRPFPAGKTFDEEWNALVNELL
ncbi:MAG: hypothetical protein SF097_25135 [Acidobacteriota bacterium]|nr:hypothetical protein [Acidobacteriota bacterium]